MLWVRLSKGHTNSSFLLGWPVGFSSTIWQWKSELFTSNYTDIYWRCPAEQYRPCRSWFWKAEIIRKCQRVFLSFNDLEHFCQASSGLSGPAQPPLGPPTTLPMSQDPISTQSRALSPCPSDTRAVPVSSALQPCRAQPWAPLSSCYNHIVLNSLFLCITKV